MKANLKALLALIIILAASFGIATYAYAQHHPAVVVAGLVAGLIIALADWLARRPGRRQQHTLTTYGGFGAAAFGVLVIVFGHQQANVVIFFIAGVLISLCLYIAAITWIVARNSPGYWKR